MDRFYDILDSLLKAAQKTKSNNDYNNINDFEMGPSTMKNLDDLYGDDESNTPLNNTNSSVMMDHVNAIYSCMAEMQNHLKNESTVQKLTNAGWHDKIHAMYKASCEMKDFVTNQPLADDDKTMIAGESQKKPGLWDNIRKKKEKMGKNYRPAKPGDKDRPDSDQWKKLTK